MSIPINPHNDQEDFEAFLDQYNKEIDEAEAQIDAGNYLTHDEVEKLFADRRNGNK